MAIIDIYDNVRRIDLVLTESTAPNWNPVMNHNHFNIQKGTKNLIEFKVRNNDRRPINLLGKSLQCNINYQDGKTNLIQKELKMIDPQKGLVGLVLLPHEMMNWPLGPLSFNVTIDTGDGFSRMLCVTESDRSNGWLYVNDGPYMGPSPTMTSGLYKNMCNDDPETYVWYSDIMPGSNRAYNPTGSMTLVLTTTQYSGDIKAYGSLETSMPQFTDDVWFPIDMNDSGSQITFDNHTGNNLITLRANVEWVLFSFTPENYDVNQADQDASVAFKLEDEIPEIQFRNT